MSGSKNKAGIPEYSEMDDAMPLDYTFKKLDTLIGIEFGKPREGRVGKTPIRSAQRRFLTKSLWLNNNNLTSIAGIDTLAQQIIESSETLGWIDFSFNKIKEIDPAILKFPNLTILYLHGNLIDDFNQVLILKDSSKLKRLTLHGNPVSEEDGYRMVIIYFIPQLYNLDFAPILLREKNAPIPANLIKRVMEKGKVQKK